MKMSERLVTTVLVIFALATPGVASAVGAAKNTTPTSPGACQMLNTKGIGMDGMMNDPHFGDIMYPLVLASLATGCTPVR
jgi:hypothetical protein